MKKILMMLGAIALGVSVQAASVSWKYSATGTSYGGYTVYVTTSAGGFTSLQDVTDVVLGGVVANASGTLVAGSKSSSYTGTITGLTAEKSYDFYYVVVDGDNYWVSSKQTVTTAAENAGAATTTFAASSGKTMLSASATGSFGGGGSSSVPEPTSGLLLVLGMAGLALRRRA